MSTILADNIFLDALRQNFLEHLKKEPTSECRQNQAKDIVDDAISQDIGKLSRIFDALDLPIVERDDLYRKLKQAGNMSSYMTPMLIEAATFLLNKERTKLSSEVIEAIGWDKYNQLVTNDEGIDDNLEKEVARQVMSSVILNYSQSVNNFELSPEDLIIKQKCDDLFDNLSRIKAIVEQATKQNIPSDWNSNLPEKGLDNFSVQADELSQQCAKALDDEDTELSDFKSLYQNCKALMKLGQRDCEPKLHSFAENISFPLQQIATNFTLDDLREKSSADFNLVEIQEKVEVLYVLAEQAKEELERLSEAYKRTELEGSCDAQISNLRKMLDNLSTAKDIPNVMAKLPEEAQKSKIVTEYNKSIDIYTQDLEKDILKAKPPKALANIVYRFFRALVIGSLVSDTEKEDRVKFKKQNTLLTELSSLKEDSSDGVEPENSPKNQM